MRKIIGISLIILAFAIIFGAIAYIAGWEILALTIGTTALLTGLIMLGFYLLND